MTKQLLLTALATVAIAGSAHAAIIVTGGDFESPAIAALSQPSDIPMWYLLKR